MNMHAVFIRGILIVAFSMGLCVAMLHRAYTPRPLQIATAVPARIAAPRIVGQPAAVVLPTVRVRPTAADIAAALESTDDVAAAAYIEAASVAPLGGHASLPGLHLDMPYYSFGKTLPRVSKE
jgi:hypothetical protein